MRALQISMVAAMLAACGTDPAPVDGPLDPAPPEGGQQLATTTYRLDPGQEKYICYQFYSPDDAVAITHVSQISGLGIHHFGLFQAFGRNEPDEVHECNTLIKETWLPIWGANTGSHELSMPDGTGFVIQPATQYIIQLHLKNDGDEPLDIRGGVNLSYEHDISKVIPAGMYALGSFALEIPASSTDYQVPVACDPGKDMHVFGVLPHMHKLGTKIEVTKTPSGGSAQPFYKIDPWIFGEQPLDMIDTTLATTDSLNLTCTYTNPMGQTVSYGESSDNEMCFFVLFYYPYDHLDGCIVR